MEQRPTEQRQAEQRPSEPFPGNPLVLQIEYQSREESSAHLGTRRSRSSYRILNNSSENVTDSQTLQSYLEEMFLRIINHAASSASDDEYVSTVFNFPPRTDEEEPGFVLNKFFKKKNISLTSILNDIFKVMQSNSSFLAIGARIQVETVICGNWRPI